MDENAIMKLMSRLRSPQTSEWDPTKIIDKTPGAQTPPSPGGLAPEAPNMGALGAFAQPQPELNPANPVGSSGPSLPSQTGNPESSTLDDLLKRHAVSRKKQTGGLDGTL